MIWWVRCETAGVNRKGRHCALRGLRLSSGVLAYAAQGLVGESFGAHMPRRPAHRDPLWLSWTAKLWEQLRIFLHAPPMESEQRRHAATDVGIRTFNAALQYARPCDRRT